MINPTELARHFVDAYDNLGRELAAGFAAAELSNTSRDALELARERVLLQYAPNPKDLGSNEETRKARVAELTHGEAQTARAAEAEERKAKHSIELGRLRVDGLWALLRIVELGAPDHGDSAPAVKTDAQDRSGSTIATAAGSTDGGKPGTRRGRARNRKSQRRRRRR